MPYCPKCGVDNPAAARFCDQCGAALIPVPAPAVSAPAYIPPAPPVVAPPVAAPPVAAPPPRPAAVPASLGGAVQCAQCGASALPGEAFCDNCGAPLQAGTPAPSVGAGVAPQVAYPAPVAAAPTPAYTPPAPVAPAVRTALAPARLVLKSGAALALPAAGQAVLGRADAVSNFTPDVDLAAHGAIDSGVGRRHARIFIQQGQVMLEDLDSTNGTFLNGNRLKPRQAMPIRDQDTLQLGSLALQFCF